MWFPILAGASSLGGLLAYYYANNYRRLIEYWYIALKEDFKICDVLKDARENLEKHLKDETTFSQEFVACFSNPLEIDAADPPKVVAIKNVLCALNKVEKIFEDILSMDISRDRYLPSLYYEFIPKLYNTVAVLVTELGNLNQSSADVEILIGPYLRSLIDKLQFISSFIDVNNIPAQSLGQAMQLFPKPNDEQPNQGLANLSHLIIQLPVYFQELQDLIDPGSIQNLSARDSKALQSKTKSLLKSLEKLAKSKDFSEYVPSGLSTVKELLQQLPTLLSSTGEFTQKSHEKLQALLNQLKHEQLPNFIADLESAEEHFSLRPNYLVERILEPMNKFYNKVAELSKYCVSTSNVLRNPVVQTADAVKGVFSAKSTETPDILCDDTFINVVQTKRIARWIEADYAQHDTSLTQAAERFFKNASTVMYDEDRAQLIADYKIIQPYYAKLYPEMDVLFVEDFPSWLDQFNSGDSTIALLKQNLLQAAFKSKTIEANSDKHDQLYRASQEVTFNQLLENHKDKIDQYEIGMSKLKKGRSYKRLEAVGDRPEYKPPFYRALAHKPSEKLKNFIGGDFKTWLEKNVDPLVFSQLCFEPKQMINLTLVDDQIQAYANIPSVLFYKKLLCSLAMIQQDLLKMEAMYESNISSPRLVWSLIRDGEIWSNLGYANGFIKEAITSPELRAILSKGLHCLEPLKNIPAVSGYLDQIDAKIKNPPSENAVNVDLVARWKEQQKLVKETLARTSKDKPVIQEKTSSSSVKSATTEKPEDKVLQDILKQIYQLPQLIRKFNPERQHLPEFSEDALTAKAETLVNALTVSKYDLKTLQSILDSVNKLNTAVTEVGSEAKLAVIAAEKKLRQSILSSADETEFQLSYKPGVLTLPLSDTLNSLFRDLLVDFPLTPDEKVELFSNSGSIDTRIAREKQRLNSFPETRQIKLKKMNEDLRAGFQALRIVSKEMSDPLMDFEGFIQAYQKLQPYLVQVKTDYNTDVFLRELQTNGDLKQRLDSILALKGKVFLLVEQEQKGYDDMERRCKERIQFLEQLKQTQEQQAVKAKQMFRVDVQLDAEFQYCDNKLNAKTKSKIAPHRDPILNAFKSILYVMNLAHKNVVVEKKENFITAFDDLREKWNEACAKQIRERAEKMSPKEDMGEIIKIEVKKLYSEYSCMIVIYKQLEIMSEHIKTNPSKNHQLNLDRMKMLDQLKADLSTHDLSPRERLTRVAKKGQSSACKTLFEKESDPFFLRHFRKLLKLFGWINPVQRLASDLQKKFEDFKKRKDDSSLPENPILKS